MGELEFLQTISRESIAVVTVIILILLVIRPKDKQIEENHKELFEKNRQMEKLLKSNEVMTDQTRQINENIAVVVNTQAEHITSLVKDVGSISDTMKEISGELQSLSHSQYKLEKGQEELWEELVQLKKGE